jgi:hypothetical protein
MRHWNDVLSDGLPGVVRAQRVEPTRSCGMGVAVVLGVIAPLQGYMLLCTSDTHGAHVDPHPGNFRWVINVLAATALAAAGRSTASMAWVSTRIVCPL